MSDTQVSGNEARGFGRIEDRLVVEMWRVEEDEYEIAASRIVGERSLHGKMNAAEQVEDPGQRVIVDLLQTALRRLDEVEHRLERTLTLVERLAGRGASREEQDQIEASSFDVSGSGVGVLSPVDLAVGQALRLVVHMPGSPPVRLRALGRVATTLPPDGEERPVGRFRLGVEFTAINEDDRQQLIHYIFQRQRALLRSAQGEERA